VFAQRGSVSVFDTQQSPSGEFDREYLEYEAT